MSDIDCRPIFSLFDGTRCGDVYQFAGPTIWANLLFFFQLTTNYHTSLILVLVLSHLNQRLSIQSLQLRLKSANKKKNRLYFIKYSTCLLVLEKANCNKNLIKCFASIYLVLLIIWVFVIAHPVFFHSTRLWLNKNDPMKRFIKNILTI